MWNAINKINAFLSEYGMFSCFMVTGLKMEVLMSGWVGFICGSFNLRLPPVRAAWRDSHRCVCVCVCKSVCVWLWVCEVSKL